MQMERRISDLDRRFERLACQEIFEGSRSGSASDCDATEKSYATSSIAVRGVRHFVVVQFAANFQSGPAGCIRNVIDYLRDRIRSLKLRPLETAQAGKEITAKSDAREAAGERSVYTCIQAVG